MLKLEQKTVVAVGKLDKPDFMKLTMEHRNRSVRDFLQLFVCFFKRDTAHIERFNLHFGLFRDILKHLIGFVRCETKSHGITASDSFVNGLFHDIKIHFAFPVISGADVIDKSILSVLHRADKHKLLRNRHRISGYGFTVR